MKGREAKGAPSADLLVCFPSRAHLTLMPKPICSPARPSEPNKRHHNHHHHHHHHHHLLKKSTTRGPGQASPLLWSKSRSMGSEISEPTSPKVTCAGQIKVRHKTSSCKSWQSVMEEIERIHTNRQQHKKKPSWVEALGFKKEIMQFLTCLRSIRFDFRCFGSFHESDITSDDEDEEEEDEDQYHENHVVVEASEDSSETSRTVFSKWFMVLQEDQNNGFCRELDKKEREKQSDEDGPAAVTGGVPSVPPPNALLLMRCRSAPVKSWLEGKKKEEEEKEEEEEEEENEDGEDEHGGREREKELKKAKSLKCLMEEEKRKNKTESLMVMRYDPDLYNISSDIAKETWVVGGMRDALSKSRSWKR